MELKTTHKQNIEGVCLYPTLSWCIVQKNIKVEFEGFLKKSDYFPGIERYFTV